MPPSSRDADVLEGAAAAIAAADGLVVAAGAGMGVDSGLPDFRGNEGFWRHYPPYRHLRSFIEMAQPRGFLEDPAIAWGFYGHRRRLYLETTPHEGFGILRRWGAERPTGAFVFTSNVDGHFQQAGFDPDRVVECHGTLLRDQCLHRCGQAPWGTVETPAVDEATMRALPPLPACPGCGGLARPNVLMFGDADWDPRLTAAQEQRFETWLRGLDGPLVVVECGAGSAVPTVRHLSEHLVAGLGARLVRINPREPAVPPGQQAVAAPALRTLRQLDALLAPTTKGRP